MGYDTRWKAASNHLHKTETLSQPSVTVSNKALYSPSNIQDKFQENFHVLFNLANADFNSSY